MLDHPQVRNSEVVQRPFASSSTVVAEIMQVSDPLPILHSLAWFRRMSRCAPAKGSRESQEYFVARIVALRLVTLCYLV
jgi:hypothetical protein